MHNFKVAKQLKPHFLAVKASHLWSPISKVTSELYGFSNLPGSFGPCSILSGYGVLREQNLSRLEIWEVCRALGIRLMNFTQLTLTFAGVNASWYLYGNRLRFFIPGWGISARWLAFRTGLRFVAGRWAFSSETASD